MIVNTFAYLTVIGMSIGILFGIMILLILAILDIFKISSK